MSLRDRKIIVTGGPTREWIDPVRFITNPSSGKMGIALATAAAERNKKVVFIHGPIDTRFISEASFTSIPVDTTADLLDAVLRELEPRSVLIMAAAPVDYAPVKKSDLKIKKTKGSLKLKLARTPDILKYVSKMKRSDPRLQEIFVVGFAAETNDTDAYAREKLREKNCDIICLNDVSRTDAGFGTDTNIITIFTREGEVIPLPLMEKKDIANRILQQIELAIGEKKVEA
jgi:phosphopantothenoylcysteine decarboxylase/phosphopantothenate--cysteine ligase